MGRKADISDFVKGQICALRAEGYAQTVIAIRLKVSRHAVQNALRESPADNLPRRSKTGHKRKTTIRQDRFLKNVVVRSPHASSSRMLKTQYRTEFVLVRELFDGAFQSTSTWWQGVRRRSR
jgi:hypothetical protein